MQLNRPFRNQMQSAVLKRLVLNNYRGESLINAFDCIKLLPTGPLNKGLDLHQMGFTCRIELCRDDNVIRYV